MVLCELHSETYGVVMPCLSFCKTTKQNDDNNRMCFVHVAKFRYPNVGSGGESNSLSDVGLLCSRAQGRFCRVYRGRGEDHGVTPQVLLPRWWVPSDVLLQNLVVCNWSVHTLYTMLLLHSHLEVLETNREFQLGQGKVRRMCACLWCGNVCIMSVSYTHLTLPTIYSV